MTTLLRPKAERQPLDFYPTPLPLCHAVCEWLEKEGFGPPEDSSAPTILEPSCGSGNFIQAAAKQWPGCEIQAIDLNPLARLPALEAGADHFSSGDFLQAVASNRPRLIIGNPPYNQAEDHVRHALSLLHPEGTLAFVLRLNFLGATKRLQLWKDFPPLCVAPIVPRPDFTGDGGDSTEYALYVWKRIDSKARHSYLGEHVTWKKEKKCRKGIKPLKRPLIPTLHC